MRELIFSEDRPKGSVVNKGDVGESLIEIALQFLPDHENLTAGQRYGVIKIVTIVEVPGFPPLVVVIPFSFKLPH